VLVIGLYFFPDEHTGPTPAIQVGDSSRYAADAPTSYLGTTTRIPTPPLHDARPTATGSDSPNLGGSLSYHDGSPVADAAFSWCSPHGVTHYSGKTTARGEWQIPISVKAKTTDFLYVELGPVCAIEAYNFGDSKHNLIALPELKTINVGREDHSGRRVPRGKWRLYVMPKSYGGQRVVAGRILVERDQGDLFFVIGEGYLEAPQNVAKFRVRLPAQGTYELHCSADDRLVLPESVVVQPPQTVSFQFFYKDPEPVLQLREFGMPATVTGQASFINGTHTRIATIDNGRVRMHGVALERDTRIAVELEDGRLIEAVVSRLLHPLDSATYYMDLEGASRAITIKAPGPGQEVVLLFVEASGELRLVSGPTGIQDHGLPFYSKKGRDLQIYRMPEAWDILWLVTRSGSLFFAKRASGSSTYRLTPVRTERILSIDLERQIAPVLEQYGEVTLLFEVQLAGHSSFPWLMADGLVVRSVENVDWARWSKTVCSGMNGKIVARYQSADSTRSQRIILDQ